MRANEIEGAVLNMVTFLSLSLSLSLSPTRPHENAHTHTLLEDGTHVSHFHTRRRMQHRRKVDEEEVGVLIKYNERDFNINILCRRE